MNAIHRTKQPNRPHFIREWAEHRGYERAVDLATAIDADKSVVSRWYSGATPQLDYQEKLAALFLIEREALFRHPDQDWFARFFAGRQADEIERMRAVLEAGFPRRKTG